MKSAIRVALYRELYETTYKFPVEQSRGQHSAGGISGPMNGGVEGVPPENLPTKPYEPPTDPEDFARVLAPPLR